MQDNSSIPDPTHTEALPQPSESDLIAPGEGTEDTAVALEPTTEVMPSLEHMLKEAELKAAEHHDAWLRAKAETENVRRRAQEDIAKAGKFSVERFAGELLAVRDSLEAALATETPSAESLKAGVELTLKQLTTAFDKSRLVEINPVGEKFDPHKHQAISQIEAPDGITEANIVLTVLQKGYALHERVIRPALVIVSKPKAAPTA